MGRVLDRADGHTHRRCPASPSVDRCGHDGDLPTVPSAHPPAARWLARTTWGPMDATPRRVHLRAMAGSGKGWARGRTAASDPRVARAAAAHVGLSYQRRTPIELCRWPGVVRRPTSYEWTAATAYAVGLLATDGCLIERGHSIAFVSKDVELVETLLACLGREPRYRVDRTRVGRPLYRFQTKDVVLYRWLVAAGLTPRKSLTLGSIRAPDALLAHVVRGLLDGDGSIINKVWRADTGRRSDYYYEHLRTQFVSASRAHLDWLRSRLSASLGLRGSICTFVRPDRRPIHRLAYGKRDSMTLLQWLYVDPTAPCLFRKRSIWYEYAGRHRDLPKPAR